MELTVSLRKKLRNFELAVDFSVHNEVFALLGASGCGKSMTLKCIAGIETPDSGRIVWNGRVLYDSAQNINLKPQQRHVGYLFQNYALFPNMTIKENLLFASSGTDEQKREKAAQNLRRFSLTELADAYPRELSGGQQQRAAFARILGSDAELLLLDEPFSALDSYLKWQLELELEDVLFSYGGAALLVSHDRGEVYRLADKVAVISQGRMEQAQGTKALFQQPETLAAAMLTGCKNISPASRLDDNHIRAEAWQLDLRVPAAETLRYAGIRAHFLERKESPAENTFPMEIVKVIEDTFSYLVMVRRKGTEAQAIRWEPAKEEWQRFKASGKELYLHFPPEKIMQMER